MLLCSIMGCFLPPHSFGNAPGHVFKNPAFSFANLLKMRLWKRIFGFGGPSPLSGSQWVRRWHFSWELKMPRTAGEKRVLGFLTPKSTHHTKKWALEQKAEIYFLGRAHPHLCVFVWRAWISPKTGFENRTNFAETTENVVPKWRGQKRSFCTGGSKKGHLRSGSKMVPIHFSFHCTSFPIHLQEHKENYLMFLDFSLLENMSLSIVLMLAFLLCNKYLCFPWFCSMSMFLLVVFVFFVPLLLILLTHSLFLDFCLSIFRVVFLFGLCFFLILLVFLSSSCRFVSPLVFPSLNHL